MIHLKHQGIFSYVCSAKSKNPNNSFVAQFRNCYNTILELLKGLDLFIIQGQLFKTNDVVS